MGTRLVFVPGNHVHLELLCPKTVPIMLAEMLHGEGIPADYVDLSGLKTFADYPTVPEDASSTPRYAFMKLGQIPFPNRQSNITPVETVAEQLQKDTLAKILKAPAPSLIAWYMETRNDFQRVRELSSYVKACSPEIHQTAIGPYIVHYGAAALNNVKSIDTGITGDPIAALTALSECVDDSESWGRIPGLLFHTRSGIASSPRNVYPCRNVLPHEFIFSTRRRKLPRKEKQIPLYSLTFNCNNIRGYGLKPGVARPLQKSVSQLIDEMSFLNRYHGAGIFHIEASHVSDATLERFADTLLANNFMTIYSLGDLTEPFDEKLADRLFASGCRAVGFSTPTGSQRLLEDFYGCEMSISAMRATLRHCRAAGLFTVAHLCFPCPWDDYHTRAETDLFLEACRPDGITIHSPELLPESIWFSRAPAYGFLFDHRAFQQWVEYTHSQQNATPYRMQNWKRGRSAEAKRSLAAHAENMGCITGVSERHGLLARIARSVMDEAIFLKRLKAGIENHDITELAALIQCIGNTLDTLHTDSMQIMESAKAL